jgi:hypothetical protein
MTFVLTGLDIEAKAALAERTLWASVPGGRSSFDEVDVQLLRWDQPDSPTNAGAMAHLRVTVKDTDEAKVGRAFSNTVIEMVLASYPGFFTTSPPSGASVYGIYWPCLIPATFPRHTVTVGGETATVEPSPPGAAEHDLAPPDPPQVAPPVVTSPPHTSAGPDATHPTRPVPGTPLGGDTARAPLGLVVGARSGDKGGNANVGVWVRSAEAYEWMDAELTAERFATLVPEAAGLVVERHDLANLWACNFVVRGWLGRGVAACTRLDTQAKGLGEYLRSRWTDIPRALLPDDVDEAIRTALGPTTTPDDPTTAGR